jgi:molybdate transport system regulatory protein
MKKSRANWKCGNRLWIEQDGRVVLGKGRVMLLEAIAKEHSIRKAASSLGMSYRRAWLLVQSMNEASAEPLIETAIGGNNGGGAQLTPHGQAAIELYHGLESAVGHAAERFLKSHAASRII